MDILIGTFLGGYKLTRFLGSGGLGAVYLAEDSVIGQQVAIKVVRTDAADYPDPAGVQQVLERFKHEVRVVASLDHLHILRLYRYGEEETESGQRAYMVMHYRSEGSLWDWLRQRATSSTSCREKRRRSTRRACSLRGARCGSNTTSSGATDASDYSYTSG